MALRIKPRHSVSFTWFARRTPMRGSIRFLRYCAHDS